jgi:hypothetical protein
MRCTIPHARRYLHLEHCLYNSKGMGEVQSTLNQKLGSKSSRTVNFVSRFVFLIKFKFKIHTFNNHYESQYKINDSKKLLINFLIQSVLNLSHLQSKDAKKCVLLSWVDQCNKKLSSKPIFLYYRRWAFDPLFLYYPFVQHQPHKVKARF